MPNRKYGTQSGIVHVFAILLVLIAVIVGVIYLSITNKGSVEKRMSILGQSYFADISPKDENYKAINYLAREGVVKDEISGYFNPDNEISRVEWVQMLVALSGETPDANIYRDCFADIRGELYEADVCFAKEQGWLNEFNNAQSFNFNLIRIVNAQSSETSFNPAASLSNSEATSSLSTLLDGDVKVEVSGNLTKRDAAKVMYESVATIPFNQDQYSPNLDGIVEQFGASDLVESYELKAKQNEAEL